MVFKRNVTNKISDAEFVLIMNEHRKMVFSIAMQILNNTETAEDITQDVFVKIYFGLSKFDYKSKLSTWIYKIAYNTAISAKRKLKDSHEYSDIAPDMLILNQDYDWEKENNLQKIALIVKSLKEEDRIIIMLFYYENNSVDDISKIMNISISNVKVRLHRIRKNIQEHFYQN